MKIFLRILAALFFVLVVFVISTISWIDRTPYKQKDFYKTMSARLDSLEAAFPGFSTADSIKVGWSRVNITPDQVLPLAGYGARDPKEFTAVHDSVFFRTYVIENAEKRIAIVSGELLIIHPEVSQSVYHRLRQIGWEKDDVYFSATHTHSSLGAWAPGFVGNLFAGEYDPKVVDFLAGKLVESIQTASQNLKTGSFGFAEISVPDYVKNRLVKEKGQVDTSFKLLFLNSDTLSAVHTVYAAHATCLNQKFTEMSGDYPASLVSNLTNHPTLDFASYSAGAVASMGPGDTGNRQWEKAATIGSGLAGQLDLLLNLGIPAQEVVALRSFKIPLELREPNFKISGDLRIKPWVFESLVGEYPVEIEVMQINDVLLIGLPCDFSGELALPLYKLARRRGLNLVITSFNGGYIGYVPKDEWYELNKYETRTMSWYGADNGDYFTEIIQRIIEMSAK